MAQPPRRPRTLQDARTEAEAAFKKTTTKPVEAPVAKAAVPGVRELVSLRIDQDVLAWFRDGGPGYQTTTLGFAAYVTSFITTDIGRGNAWSYTVAALTLVIAIFYMRLLYGRGDVRS